MTKPTAMPTRDELADLIAREVCGVENLAALYADKRAWIADQGRRYDINFPYQCDVMGCADAIIAILPDPEAIRNEALEEAVGEIGVFALGAEYPIKVTSLIDAIRSLKTPAEKDLHQGNRSGEGEKVMKINIEVGDIGPHEPARVGNVYPIKGGRGMR